MLKLRSPFNQGKAPFRNWQIRPNLECWLFIRVGQNNNRQQVNEAEIWNCFDYCKKSLQENQIANSARFCTQMKIITQIPRYFLASLIKWWSDFRSLLPVAKWSLSLIKWWSEFRSLLPVAYCQLRNGAFPWLNGDLSLGVFCQLPIASCEIEHLRD